MGAETLAGGLVLVFGSVSNTTVTIKENVGIHTKKSDDNQLTDDSALYVFRWGTGGTGTNNGSTTVTAEAGTYFQGRHGIRAELSIGARDNTYTDYESTYTVSNAGELDVEELGLVVTHHDWAGTIDITHSGKITAGKTGIHTSRAATSTVTVSDGGEIISGERGIHSYGRGGRTVTVADGARVEATGKSGDEWGVEMEIWKEPDPSDNPARTLTADQKAASVTASGEIDSVHGGIKILNHGPGTSTVTVTESGSVTGTQYGILLAHSSTGTGENTVDVSGTVSGTETEAIKAEGQGDTTVRLRDNFRIIGNIRLSSDNDEIQFIVAKDMVGEVLGDISRLGTVVKSGMGTARLGGELQNSGSSVTVSEGNLVLRAHVNLGSGTFTVENGARLTIEVGPDEDDFGRISAGAISLSDQPVHVVIAKGNTGQSFRAAQQLEQGITVFRASGFPGLVDYSVVFDDDTSISGSRVNGDGSISGDVTAKFPQFAGGGGGGDSTFLVVGAGALAYLLWDMGLFDEETPTGVRSSTQGLEYRVQLLGHATAPAAALLPANGVETSLRAHLGGGFHAELSGTPHLSVATGQNEQSGRRYGLGLGWQAGAFSTDIGYSRATLDTWSTFSNLPGLGTLSGTHGQRHDRLRANARLRLDTGGLVLAPSLAVYGGSISDKGYTASSPVWLAEVPAVTRDYSGWKAGMSVTPRSSLQVMGLHWRPELRLETARLADGGGEHLEIVQRDRAGALRLQTRARTTLPRSVHALGGGLTVAGGEDWSLRGGYVAMLADGDLEHAAIAGFRMRF